MVDWEHGRPSELAGDAWDEKRDALFELDNALEKLRLGYVSGAAQITICFAHVFQKRRW